MTNEKIVEYVKQAHKQGQPRYEIYSKLSEIGVSHDDIMDSFRQALGGEVQIHDSKVKEPTPEVKKASKLNLALVVILVIIAGFSIYLMKGPLIEVFSPKISTNITSTSTSVSTTTSTLETSTRVITTTIEVETTSTTSSTSSTMESNRGECDRICETKDKVAVCTTGQDRCRQIGGYQVKLRVNECPMSNQICCCVDPQNI